MTLLSSSFSLGFGQKLLAVAMFLTLGASAGCNHDNCYRALFPCASPLALSTASAFCAQVTASPGLPYPSRAVSACGTTADRYISACGCGPACTTTIQTSTTTTTTTTSTTTSTTTTGISCPTPTQGYAIPNGGFECGIQTWFVQVPDAAASYFIGAPAQAGSNSFQVQYTPPTQGMEGGVSARIISLPVRVQPNVPYRLSFWTYFDNLDAGFIGVMINNVVVYTIDARDHGWGGNFTLNTIDYTTKNDTDQASVTFEFLFVPSVASLDRIDSVTFAPI
ncbi:hypothetical protein HD806DRAFT_503136 [Xylariaceae sp. AK1471]|nr:hypothetical protein HD806DRAFT_503136 [Xylariaceae sp. AK1471]